ncbi:MAG TPA: flavin reductase, partial [Dehalococcoidia bacterium]|nr:flavin reductase [Dehalococcoidia bacterium]
FSRTDNGAIVLDDVPAWAELTVVEINATGDHAVVIAEVIDVGLNSDNPDILTLKELGLNYGG